MSSDYEEFVKHIFYEHIEKRLARVRERFLPRHPEEFEYHIARIIKATRATRFIRDYAESDEDIIRTFTPEMLKQTVREVRYGTALSNTFVLDTGIADVIQDYFGEIVDGMSVDYFPKEDLQVLQQSGSSEPRRDVIAMVYLIKSRKEQLYV